MARAISKWPILVGLVILLIGCTDMARTPSAPTLPASLATSQPGATATPTSIRRVTATEQPTALPTAQDSRFTVYGFRAEGAISFYGFSAFEFPAGRETGTLAMESATQDAFFALAPDAEHAYVFAGAAQDRWLAEVMLPTMRLIKRTSLPDAANEVVLIGHGSATSTHPLAVSTDGREVYVETARSISAPAPHTDFAIAVYDVEQGAFVRSVRLELPDCWSAGLFALPDRQLLVRCPGARDMRWLDIRLGREVARLQVGWVGAVLSRDRRFVWIVADNAHLFEIDVTKRAITWTSELSDGLAPIVPNQQPHLSANGKRLFVLAAPGPAELWRQGRGSEVWILETASFHHLTDVKLPTPAYDFVPSPDGRQLVVSTLNWDNPSERGTYLMDTGTGRELNRWPWALVGMQTRDGAD